MNQSLGFSLIEVMVSMMLLALVLLGFDAMQVQALREARQAYDGAVLNQEWRNDAEKKRGIDIDGVDAEFGSRDAAADHAV